MPRGNDAQPANQLARVLIIGDGKCGKTDWAARAAEGGFNVLYIDGDVGAQTIGGLPRDRTHPVKTEVMDRIFILPAHDTLINGGLDYRFVKVVKRFTNQPVFRWNDSQSREWSLTEDGDRTEDEVWEIRPGRLDHTCVLVIDSWTAVSQSAMNWASDELGISLDEISEEERRKMRSVYQAAGEKLTQFLIMLRSIRCHVIVIAHPREFTKTEKPAGKSARQVSEADLKVLWTKMVPASSSNNHAFQMAKFFTDIAWLETSAMGEYMIDFRPTNERLSGSHLNERLNTREGGRFVDLIKHIGGTIPGETQSFDPWLTIHSKGFDAPTRKPALVLGAQNSGTQGAPTQVKGLSLNLGGPK